MQAIIRCMTQACQRLQLNYRFIDTNHNVILIEQDLLFQLNRTPFNTESMAAICKDKEHQYQLLHPSVNMPKTIGFLDYDCQANFHQYLLQHSQTQVIANIEAEFNYPVIIKPNRGSLGNNVFCCKNRQQLSMALTRIFDKQSQFYDYVAIAQEFVRPKEEYRVICFDGEPVLSYQRIFGTAEFGAKYWETDQGRTLHNDSITNRVAEEFAPALNLKGLRYVGLDIILDQNNQLFLIELNSGPQVNHFVQNHGDEQIIQMYEKIFTSYYKVK